jgi:hypothetical protein
VVKTGFCQRNFGLANEHQRNTTVKRAANQWVAWGGRFHSNQFKTTFYLQQNGMSSLPLGPQTGGFKTGFCQRNFGQTNEQQRY